MENFLYLDDNVNDHTTHTSWNLKRITYIYQYDILVHSAIFGNISFVSPKIVFWTEYLYIRYELLKPNCWNTFKICRQTIKVVIYLPKPIIPETKNKFMAYYIFGTLSNYGKLCDCYSQFSTKTRSGV